LVFLRSGGEGGCPIRQLVLLLAFLSPLVHKGNISYDRILGLDKERNTFLSCS
jgi:hypothetical protein